MQDEGRLSPLLHAFSRGFLLAAQTRLTGKWTVNEQGVNVASIPKVCDGSP